MGRNALTYKPVLKGVDLPWRVVAECTVLYPNKPEETHQGMLTVAYFWQEHDAKNFVDHSVALFGYKVEKNE